MIITKIKRIGSTNRFHVYIDEEWAGVFLDEILALYHFKTDMQIDDEVFKEIKLENDKKVAFDMAVSYMEKYVVSEKGIRDYLKKKNFDDSTIKNTIEKLKEYNFVDDRKFAQNYFESLSASKGKRVISNKLKEKGINSEIINEILENVDDEDEIEKAKIIAEKFVKNRQNDTKCKQKCLAHLIYKGYDYNVAQQATNYALEDKGENDDWI